MMSSIRAWYESFIKRLATWLASLPPPIEDAPPEQEKVPAFLTAYRPPFF